MANMPKSLSPILANYSDRERSQGCGSSKALSSYKGRRLSSSHYSSQDNGSEWARLSLTKNSIPCSSSSRPNMKSSSQSFVVVPTATSLEMFPQANCEKNFDQNYISSFFSCFYEKGRVYSGFCSYFKLQAYCKLSLLILEAIFLRISLMNQYYDAIQMISSVMAIKSSLRELMSAACFLYRLLRSSGQIMLVQPAYFCDHYSQAGPKKGHMLYATGLYQIPRSVKLSFRLKQAKARQRTRFLYQGQSQTQVQSTSLTVGEYFLRSGSLKFQRVYSTRQTRKSASMWVSWKSLAIAVRTLSRGSLGQEWEFRARLRRIGMTLRSY